MNNPYGSCYWPPPQPINPQQAAPIVQGPPQLPPHYQADPRVSARYEETPAPAPQLVHPQQSNPIPPTPTPPYLPLGTPTPPPTTPPTGTPWWMWVLGATAVGGLSFWALGGVDGLKKLATEKVTGMVGVPVPEPVRANPDDDEEWEEEEEDEEEDDVEDDEDDVEDVAEEES